MHRSYLIFLFVLLFSCYDANAQDLVLKEVSVDTISSNFPQQIKLTWLFDSQIDTVVVCRCTTNCYDENNYINDIAKLEMNKDTLSWIDREVSPISQNYYSIHRGKGKSAPQNNMVLKAQISGKCNNAVSLSWNSWVKYNNNKEFDWSNPHNNERDTLDYNVFFRVKDSGDFILKDAIKGVYVTNIDPADEMSHNIEHLANNQIYEFVIQAISKSDTVHVFSNIVVCKTGFVNDDRVNITITCVDVVEEQEMKIDVIKVNIETANFPEPFQKLYLYRAKSIPETPLSLVVIDSAAYNPDNIYSFTDTNAKPHTGTYYYMAVAHNNCKLNDTSNVVTNIYLYGWRENKYEDGIIFFRIASGIYESYELFRIVYEKEYSLGAIPAYTNYYINFLTFMEDGVAITYKIRSETGCASNSVTIPHEPIIRFPNAFNPRDVKAANKTFYPILQFPSEDNYLFVIYNRWGQELYRSTLPPVYREYDNIQGRWDGTFKGSECPPGIYTYKITYSLDGTRKYSDSGSFLLVR